MDDRTKSKQFDVSFYISKFVIPLIERKWIILFFFLLSVIMAIIVLLFARPEYVSQATLLIEEPRSEISKAKQDSVAPRRAEMSYVAAEAEKLKGSSFAAEVLKILPDRAREDLMTRMGIVSQITEDFKERIGLQAKSKSPLLTRWKVLTEIRNRVQITSNDRSALIWITASSFDQEMAPVLAQSYIDVCLALNLEENKKGISSEKAFAEKQQEDAFRKYQDAEQEIVDFKRRFDIPGDFDEARDVEIHLQLERLKSRLAMAKERFDYMNKIYFDNQMKEAGIVGNIRVIDPPAFPADPSRKAEARLIIMLIMGGLVLGIGTALLLDYVKGPIRHEIDITDAGLIPVIGHIPKVSE
ncbi:MAG: hypothetical protein JXA35_01730 [Deltaproteobacteria bacterium]|nr:hypothetical protein [Deltaproteobacteria bacterium]